MLTLLAAISQLADFATVYQVGRALHDRWPELIEKRKDAFLNYDPARLLGQYAAECPIGVGLPYAEMLNFLELAPAAAAVTLRVSPRLFRLKPGTAQWNTVQSEAFVALKQSGRVPFSEPAIRLSGLEQGGAGACLVLQKAEYYDQARTHLVLDWRPPDGSPSLREQLSGQYGARLPAFSDRRLANTVGVACMLYYRHKGQWVPYLVRRASRVGVYPGGLHCTASGVAKWPDMRGEPTFEHFFTRHVLAELEEEVGLRPSDVADFVPVALCRDFARGGKPQLFFAGTTSLTHAQLRKARLDAIQCVKGTLGSAEVQPDPWWLTKEVVMLPGQLAANMRKYKVTLEAAAADHYGRQYLASRNPARALAGP